MCSERRRGGSVALGGRAFYTALAGLLRQVDKHCGVVGVSALLAVVAIVVVVSLIYGV